MTIAKKLMTTGGSKPVFVDDVFNIHLYDGTGSPQDIVNGMDIEGTGGLVWTKARDDTSGGATIHALIDTERGTDKWLATDTRVEQTNSNLITSFNDDGYSVGTGGPYWTNDNGYRYVSWTLLKQEGFFDVVTYTGTGDGADGIPHGLGSVPGMIMIKRMDSSTASWAVYHRGIASNPAGWYLKFEATGGRLSSSSYFSTAPTSDVFYPGSDSDVNAQGSPYVAYVFAHDAQMFGVDGDESIIKCGSYTGNGTDVTIDLGWEPDYLMLKRTDSTAPWFIVDTLRGFPADENVNNDMAFTSQGDKEDTYRIGEPVANGFRILGATQSINFNGGSYVYMAIRRTNKPASEYDSATELFTPFTTAPTTSEGILPAPHRTDFGFIHHVSTSQNWGVAARLHGPDDTSFNTTGTAPSFTGKHRWDENTGWAQGSTTFGTNLALNSYFGAAFKRVPEFMDVVHYSADGVSNRTVYHGLGVLPELMFVKGHTSAFGWNIMGTALNEAAGLALSPLREHMTFGSTAGPNNFSDYIRVVTDEYFQVGTNTSVNRAGDDYRAYLFASVPGICDIGTYTGTGSGAVDVDCGFSNGARMVLIKRLDSNGHWMFFNTATGIVAGNDAGFAFNQPQASPAADYIDPLSSGFTVNATTDDNYNLNRAAGATYLYMAIA